MPTVSYPLDTTGLASSNRVTDEVHVLTPDNTSPYRIIIPTFAPFFPDNLAFASVDGNGVHHPLVFGVDYKFIFMYVDASRAIGKVLWGGIDVINNNLNGTVVVSYQTIGDNWCADANVVKENLAALLFNPRIAYWDQITNVQQTFPPTPHALPMEATTGYQSLLDKVDEVINTIIQNNTVTNQFVQHLLREDNPHGVTKAQVGLGLVGNYADATDQEVTDLAAVNKRFLLRQLPLALANFSGGGNGSFITLSQLETILADYVLQTGMTGYVTGSQLTDALVDYVTDTELTTTLGSYATSSSVTTALSTVNTSIGTLTNQVSTIENNMLTEASLTNYVTDTQLSDAMSNVISNTELTLILADYVTDLELATILADFTPTSGATGGGDITETMLLAASFNT